MPEYVDPFEEFRKKKDADDSAKNSTKNVVEFVVQDENKPKGFLTHKIPGGFKSKDEVEIEKPPKFSTHKLGSIKTGEVKADEAKPKGFTKDRN